MDGVQLLQVLQLPPARAIGPAPVDTLRLLRPPSASAIGHVLMDGSRLIADWPPSPAVPLGLCW
jgi:hypothetical protein